MNIIKKSLGSYIFDSFNYLFMVLIMFITLYPFYYILIVSISDGKAIMNGLVKFWPIGLNLKSYEIIFQDPMIITSYINTIIYTLVGTLINLLFTILCAYPLSRKNFSGRRFFTKMIIITMLVSGGLIPTYLVVDSLGLVNKIWALVLPGAISTWNMIVMRTFFEGIPDSILESAYIDGANELGTLIKIVLPLSMPIIATMLLFYAVGHWNSFFSALIYLNEKKKYPIQIILRNIVISGDMSQQTNQMGASVDFLAIDTNIKYAVIMVATLPILLIYPFVQKHFVKGVMIGSLKG